MNASQAKAAFSTINMAKVPSSYKDDINTIKQDTANFTLTGQDDLMFYGIFGNLIAELKQKAPEAFKSAAQPKTASRPGGTAKPKAPVKQKGKRTPKGLFIYAKGVGKRKYLPVNLAKKEYTSLDHATKVSFSAIDKTLDQLTRLLKNRQFKGVSGFVIRDAESGKDFGGIDYTPYKVSSAAKPKARKKTGMTALQKANKKKREQLAAIRKEIRGIMTTLKMNDTQKTKIARQVEAYQNKVGLAGPKLDNDLKIAKEKLKLYKRFLSTDKRKFNSIKKTAVGRVQLSGTKPKAKSRPKAKTAPKPKPEKKSFRAKLFGW